MRQIVCRRQRGFTLIEILIVMAIISILSSMVLAGVMAARTKARITLAQMFVDAWSLEAEDYFLDTGEYPGAACRDDENGFPALFEALAGEKPPRGKGGPSAPYVPIHRDEVVVFDEADGSYRRATTEEIDDPRVRKFIGDPFGNPYAYRENRSRPRRPTMKRPHMKIVAAISHPPQDDVIEMILRHLGLWDPPWKRQHQARGPPRTPSGSSPSPQGATEAVDPPSDREQSLADPPSPTDWKP